MLLLLHTHKGRLEAAGWDASKELKVSCGYVVDSSSAFSGERGVGTHTLKQRLTRHKVEPQVRAGGHQHFFSLDTVGSLDVLPGLAEGLGHQNIYWNLNKFEMMLFTPHFFSQLHYILKIQMDLVLRGFSSKARVGCNSVILDFARAHCFFEVLKSLGEAVEEHGVGVVGPLSLVGVLQVQHIERLEVESAEGLLERVFKEEGVKRVT